MSSCTLITFDIKQQGESSMLLMLLMHPLVCFFSHLKLGWILYWYDIFYCKFQKFLDFKKAIYRYICNTYDIIGTKVSN